jgi:hypothetical protein
METDYIDCSVWTYERIKATYPSHFAHPSIHCSSVSLSISCLRKEDVVERTRPSDLPTRAFDVAAINFVAPTEHTMAYALPDYMLGKVLTLS